MSLVKKYTNNLLVLEEKASKKSVNHCATNTFAEIIAVFPT